MRGVTIFGIQHDRIVRGRLYMEDVDRSCGNIDQLPGVAVIPSSASGADGRIRICFASEIAQL